MWLGAYAGDKMGNFGEWDLRRFRAALGTFGTGVTVVTAQGPDGEPVGVTANSFSSVSLSPPLVLWSLSKGAWSLPAFTAASGWNVHVLSCDQEDLSARFARTGANKFSGLSYQSSAVNGAPLLHNCCARFQCRTRFVYEGGDHMILVGEVLEYDTGSAHPLLFVTGQYAVATKRSASLGGPIQDVTSTDLFTENLLGFLLGRAHYLYMHGFRAVLDELGVADADFFILSLLALRGPMKHSEIAEHLVITGISVDAPAMRALCTRHLLSPTADGYELSPSGEEAIFRIIAACKSLEIDMTSRMGRFETDVLRNLLKSAIATLDPGLPLVWKDSPRSAHE